ncbi:hypothetical protein [Methylobacterium symbioticum]|uniref:hypothetical protein n=1 Tax=Methylobacterium symbioticum TaxID=2584084 RepID=UPI00115B3DB0|nr:hypothetical protein [Methylobacterium symbioticum]
MDVIGAEQHERDGSRERNDRPNGVAGKARTHAHIQALSDDRPGRLDEVEAFLGRYNQLSDRGFRRVHRGDQQDALALVQRGADAFSCKGNPWNSGPRRGFCPYPIGDRRANIQQLATVC